MAIPTPTPTQVVDALIEHVADDLRLGDDGIITPVTRPYGVVIPTFKTGADFLEYSHLRFGGREKIPDGLSLYFFPMSVNDHYLTAPDGVEGDFRVRVQGIWKDEAPNVMTDRPGQLWRMLSDFSAALATVLSPSSLGAVNGGWILPTGRVVLKPFAHQTLPCAFTVVHRENKMNELVYFCEVAWSGSRYFVDP